MTNKLLFLSCVLALLGSLAGCKAPVANTEAQDEPVTQQSRRETEQEPEQQPEQQPEEQAEQQPEEQPEQQPAEYPKVAENTPDENLQALEALSLFDVGEIVLDLPSEALQCYGLCAAWKEEADAQTAEQNLRLEPLVALAEAIRDTAELTPATVDEAKSALEALDALRIVEVGELIVDVPANEPQCYNLPCSGAQEAADEANARRAAEVVELAARAKTLE